MSRKNGTTSETRVRFWFVAWPVETRLSHPLFLEILRKTSVYAPLREGGCRREATGGSTRDNGFSTNKNRTPETRKEGTKRARWVGGASLPRGLDAQKRVPPKRPPLFVPRPTAPPAGFRSGPPAGPPSRRAAGRPRWCSCPGSRGSCRRRGPGSRTPRPCPSALRSRRRPRSRPP